MFLIDSYRYAGGGAATIRYLIAAGGNAAADPGTGAGRGGNVQKATGVAAPAIGSYSVVRGAAGFVVGAPGGNSSFNGITATGNTDTPDGANGANGGADDISGASLTYGVGGLNDSSGSPGANRGNGGSTDSGIGGNGIVIIRYTTGSLTATGGTITTVGGDTVHTFTANGTWQRTA
jgi:hypothetical protein